MLREKSNDKLANLKFDEKANKLRFLDIWNTFIQSQEIKYINRFSFEGDPLFTRVKQRLFLKALFENGFAGVCDWFRASLDDKINAVISQYGQDSDLGDYKRFVVKANGIFFDNDGQIASGIGLTAAPFTLIRQVVNINNTNTAIAQMSIFRKNGYVKYATFAEIYGITFLAMIKKIVLTNPKIASNRMNNSTSSAIEDGLSNPFKNTLPLNPLFEESDNNKSVRADVSALLGEKFKLVDFSSGATISDFLDALKGVKEQAFSLLGQRVNEHFKKERNISNEFDNDSIIYALLEKDEREQLEIFCENYKKVFGIELKVVDLIQDKEEELKEQNQGDDSSDDSNSDKSEGEK